MHNLLVAMAPEPAGDLTDSSSLPINDVVVDVDSHHSGSPHSVSVDDSQTEQMPSILTQMMNIINNIHGEGGNSQPLLELFALYGVHLQHSQNNVDRTIASVEKARKCLDKLLDELTQDRNRLSIDRDLNHDIIEYARSRGMNIFGTGRDGPYQPLKGDGKGSRDGLASSSSGKGKQT